MESPFGTVIVARKSEDAPTGKGSKYFNFDLFVQSNVIVIDIISDSH